MGVALTGTNGVVLVCIFYSSHVFLHFLSVFLSVSLCLCLFLPASIKHISLLSLFICALASALKDLCTSLSSSVWEEEEE